MEQSEGTEGQQASVEGRDLSGESNAGSTASAALGVGMPVLQGRKYTPDDLKAASLDLLVELDEPELLMKELAQIANSRPGKSWQIVDQYTRYALVSLKNENEPKQS